MSDNKQTNTCVCVCDSLDHVTVSKLHQRSYCSRRCVELTHSILINDLPVPGSVRVEWSSFKLHSTHITAYLSTTGQYLPASGWNGVPSNCTPHTSQRTYQRPANTCQRPGGMEFLQTALHTHLTRLTFSLTTTVTSYSTM